MRPLFVFATLILLLGLVVPSIAQGGDVVWNVNYYGNGYLNGSVQASEELRGRITLDWGQGAPDGVPTDYFSARLGTYTYFNAGTWRFSVLADDGVTLRVNSQKIIDTFEAGSPAENLIGEVTLNEGFHNIQVDYREAEGNAYLYVSWAPVGIAQTAPFPEPSGSEVTRGRWLAEYYNNTSLSGSRAFANDTPSPVANWGSDAPVPEVNAEGWSARFTTSFYLDEGRYRATLRADDGVRYFVNGQLLLDQFGGVQNRTFEVEFELGSGDHTFVIEHVEYGGTAFLVYTLARVEGTLEGYVGDSDVVPQVVPTPATLAGAAPVSAETESTSTTTAASTGVTATVITAFVNIRSEPRVARGNIVSTAGEGQTFPVVGRANNGWVQVDIVEGRLGWINGRYVSTPNLLSLPVTGTGPTE